MTSHCTCIQHPRHERDKNSQDTAVQQKRHHGTKHLTLRHQRRGAKQINENQKPKKMRGAGCVGGCARLAEARKPTGSRTKNNSRPSRDLLRSATARPRCTDCPMTARPFSHLHDSISRMASVRQRALSSPRPPVYRLSAVPHTQRAHQLSECRSVSQQTVEGPCHGTS